MQKSPFSRDTAFKGRITPSKATKVDSNYDAKNSAARKEQRKKNKPMKGA